MVLASAAAAPALAQEGDGVTLEEVVRATLAANADIRGATLELEAQGAAVRAAAGAWDPVTAARVSSASERIPRLVSDGTPGIQESRSLAYALQADHPFRSGVVVSPSLAFSRTDAAAGDGSGSANSGVAAVGVTVPLLRGRGGGMAAAGERSSRALEGAARAALRHRQARAVVAAAEAYWGYAAAEARLAVLVRAEARSERILEQTRALVEADARPAVDLLPLQANLASRRAARISGERARVAARQELGRAIGADADEVLHLGAAATPLPEPPPAAERSAPPAAAAPRQDVEAARREREAARRLLGGFRGDARPRLDLGVALGYQGVEAGTEAARLVSPFYSVQGGVQTRVELVYGFPLRNRAAGGAAAEARVRERLAALREAEMARQAALDAAAAGEILLRSAEELDHFATAAALHAAAVESETLRFRLGTATIFDIINAEEGLTSATLAEIDARSRYAVALARLRFHAGVLDGDPARTAPLTRWEDSDDGR